MGDAGELYTMKGSGGPNIRKGWGHTGHPSATSLKLTSPYDLFQYFPEVEFKTLKIRFEVLIRSRYKQPILLRFMDLNIRWSIRFDVEFTAYNLLF